MLIALHVLSIILVIIAAIILISEKRYPTPTELLLAAIWLLLLQ
jgi:hypothetical protein